MIGRFISPDTFVQWSTGFETITADDYKGSNFCLGGGISVLPVELHTFVEDTEIEVLGNLYIGNIYTGVDDTDTTVENANEVFTQQDFDYYDYDYYNYFDYSFTYDNYSLYGYGYYDFSYLFK